LHTQDNDYWKFHLAIKKQENKQMKQMKECEMEEVEMVNMVFTPERG
jgi:hypothetical protein